MSRRILAAVLAVVAALALLVAMPRAAATSPRVAAAMSGVAANTVHEVTYDRYSLKVDGRRVLLQTGEFHYFRLPSPDLWRDALEKMRSAGFNGVSLYFNWAYHSPAPGVYDFTGVRDVDRLLRMIDELGLYAVVRPGPYINAETTGGGFPAWLKNVPGRARSSAPDYTAHWRQWYTHINTIIARHQVTGGGPVIAYNVENEYAAGTDAAYMEDLQNKAREDGIDVPITHNQCCDASWPPTWAAGQGAVQIPGVDDYPQSFDCPNPDVWGPWGEGVTERLRDDAPVYAAEYQAGAIDLNDAGYQRCRELTGPNYMKFFYKSNLIASGATMFGYYMTYGGTNWGWLAQPNDVYTSYDYGAAITEPRRLTAKYDEFKRQGYFLQAVAPLTKTDPAAAPVSADPAIHTQARANPDSGTQFVLVRHADRPSTADDSAVLDWTTPDGRYSVPVRITGRDAKVLVAGYDMGGQRLVWSSSEIMTHAFIDGRDVAVLYGTDGVAGATVMRYGTKPSVRVLAGSVASSYDAATGDLRLDYTHSGLARVLVTGGGRRPLLLLLGTDQSAASFWRADTGAGPILVRGTSLVRSGRLERRADERGTSEKASATMSATGSGLTLRADVERAGDIEVFAPARRLVVGSEPIPVRRTSSGSLLGSVRGPKATALPELTGWRYRGEAPEAAPGFDDSRWTVADRTTTVSPIKPPVDKHGALPVLYADDYGFHYGHVWYRGRFTATGTETTIALNAITGRKGIYHAWLNGHYLGSANGGVQADSDPPVNPDPGPGNFAIPSGLLRQGRPAILAVLVENMGHNDDWIADDTRHKQPRGLFGASVVDPARAGANTPISWRIQGARGGEDLADRTRGPLNTGGLYGERAGWHLPGYPDRSWRSAGSLAAGSLSPGVAWYRTTFKLALPKDHDVPVGLRFGGDTSRKYRVLIFLNGWNVGQYINDIGPQRAFYLPGGLLRERGVNTLALAVIAQQADSDGPGPVGLFAYGDTRGGVRVSDVPSPGYGATR